MNMRNLSAAFSCLMMALGGSPAGRGQEAKPPEVEVARPLTREVIDEVIASGRTEAVKSVEIRARVTGYLTKTAVKEGENFKKGELLFEIDARPYQAALTQAEAQLQQARAQLERAQIEVERAVLLRKLKAVSDKEYDTIVAGLEVAKANVKVMHASLDVAKLNLASTQIEALIAGRVGRVFLDAGNLVKADDTTLALLTSVDPIYVRFFTDEVTLLRAVRLVQGDDPKEGKYLAIPVEVGPAKVAKGFPYKGHFHLKDSQMNPDKGVIELRAVVPNTAGKLVPGIPMKVRLVTSAPYKAAAIDARALQVHVVGQRGQGFLFCVGEKNVVETREVKLRQEGGLWIAGKDLSPDTQVIVKGFPGMKIGMTVTPKLVAMQKSPPEKTPPAKEKEPSADLKELLKERHAVLTKVVDILMLQLQAGTVEPKALRLGQKAALEAGLEASENSAQRLDLLRKGVKAAEELHRMAVAQFKGGQIPQVEVLQAQAWLLEMRIRLLREEKK